MKRKTDLCKEKEREDKWKKRGDAFWNAFLPVKDGKPKSALLIYTFCLSIGFIFLYIFAFNVVISLLSSAVSGLNIKLGNLLLSLIACAAVICIARVLHLLMKDKRLIFAAYIWLLVYAAAVFITMMVFIRENREAVSAFMDFYIWFIVLPVISGLSCSAVWFRKDYKPAPEPEPEWKKYINRR